MASRAYEPILTLGPPPPRQEWPLVTIRRRGRGLWRWLSWRRRYALRPLDTLSLFERNRLRELTASYLATLSVVPDKSSVATDASRTATILAAMVALLLDAPPAVRDRLTPVQNAAVLRAHQGAWEAIRG